VPLFQRAVEVEPEHGWAWIGVGICHAELGHFAEASWSLEKAVALEAKLPERRPTVGVAGYLGECLRRMGDPAAARARCLEGIEAVEKSDHMYRDTFRGVCLTVLGRAALDEEDVPAARAAFAQAVGHLRGRPRALGGGHLLVQALAGLSRAGEGTAYLDEASRLFENRRGFDFSFLWCCSDDLSLFDLSRAARAAGRRDEADALLEKAAAAGSFEASQAVRGR
jgi:tetratricopeptide (TPR) repeat protein